jgi:hypothetical protein
MKRFLYAILITALLSACNTVILDPPAVDLLIDDIVFTRSSDLPSVRIVYMPLPVVSEAPRYKQAILPPTTLFT